MEFLSKLLDTSDFPARWHCGLWSSGHGWLHVISDLAVFAAYVSIPCVLVYFLRKRKDLPFPRILWLFGAFIFACGTVHLVEATLFWHPWYRLSGILKGFTAIVSWITVLQLAPTVRKALALPGLAVINSRLEKEADQRRIAEEQLRQYNTELESFSSSVVNREERMIELKHEVNELLAELARAPRYTTDTVQV